MDALPAMLPREHLAAAITLDGDDAVFATALDGTVLIWNHGATQMFGFEAGEMVKHPIARIVPLDHRSERNARLERLLEGERLARFETRYLCRDGRLCDVSVLAVPLRNDDGVIIGSAELVHAVADQSTVRERLALAADLQHILERSPSGIALYDADRINRYANTRYAEALGATPAGLHGMHVSEALGPAIHAIASGRIETAMSGTAQFFEREILQSDGSLRHDLVSYIPDHRNEGPAGLLVFVTDITQRKQAELRAGTLAERFRQLYERTPAMLHSIDSQGFIVSVSNTWLAKLGYQREEVVGRHITDFLTPDSRRSALSRSLPRFLDGGPDVQDLEYEMVCKDGSILEVRLSAIHDQDPDLGTVRHLAVIEDVTAENRAARALRESEVLLDRAGQLAGVGGWSYDLGSATVVWTDETCRIHDVAPGHRPSVDEALMFYPASARAEIAEAVEECTRDGIPYCLELPLITATGRSKWIRTAGEVEIDQGRPLRLFGSIQDITERKLAEIELADNHELMRVTLNSIGDAVITTDPHGLVQWLNPVAARLTGWLLKEAQDRPIDQVFCLVREDDRQRAPSRVQRALGTARSTDVDGPALLISRDGTERVIQDSASAIRNGMGEALGVVLVFQDISEQHRMSKEISYRASRDPLTDLLNRSEFELRLQAAFEATQQVGIVHALMFIDLDQFKQVNDACGHAAGDQLLREVAAILQSGVRMRDSLARLGGDEFCVIMEHCSLMQARRVADALCRQIEQFRFLHGGRRFRIGASIGLVPLDARWSGPAAILQAADAACYLAKEAGRNRVHEWIESEQGLQERQETTGWVTRLEEALANDRFVLLAQQIAPCAMPTTGIHIEILLRLSESDGSLIRPEAFLPPAERFNLAVRIDRWVFNAVTRWMAAQDLSRFATVSINLSGQSLADRAFQRDLADRIPQLGFDPARLCFEISETAAITHLTDAREFVRTMRALGVRIALDDFGAGITSFSYLKTLPVDFLKIDGQFVRDLLGDRLDHAAVCCFRDIAAACEAQTIAELVESADVLAELKRIGIHYAQGYLFHAPEPIEGWTAATVPVNARDSA